jgi:hypothetical protein
MMFVTNFYKRGGGEAGHICGMPNSERQSAWVSPGIAWIHTDNIRLFDNMIYRTYGCIAIIRMCTLYNYSVVGCATCHQVLSRQ